MNICTIIPARGGSKGIPRKNVAPLAGLPLLAHSIAHAHASQQVTRVIVSTDDAEIAAVARHHGAEVVWRPADISSDTASSEAALLHTLDTLQAQEGYTPDLVVFLQATSPLRPPGAIDAAIDTLRTAQADSLFSACPLHGFVWRQQGAHLASFTYDHRQRPRRQDAPEDLVENGSIYLFKPWVLRTHANRLGGTIAVYRMQPRDSFQVDEPDDLHLLAALLRTRPAGPGADLHTSLAAVRLLVLDFDGVLTDNRVLVHQDGHEAVLCYRGDGFGIEQVRAAGLAVLVLSKERNPVVAARCHKLGIEYIQSCDDKLPALQAEATTRGLQPHEIAYVGNDVNDLPCLQWVGVSVAVADALPAVRDAARYSTNAPGGYGAVREVTDMLLRAHALHPEEV